MPRSPRVPTLREPARRVPVIAEPDVLVVGGGAAGLAAAVAAARDGASTMLVERYGHLGGLATGGLIILLLTLDDGAGRQVVAGLCQELVDRMTARGGTHYPPRGEWDSDDPALVERARRWGLVWGSGPHRVRYSVAYDPEVFKLEADAMLTAAGVRPRFHTWATACVVEDGRITAVLLESKAGRQAVRPRMVIDATGDGDLFARAGEPYEHEQVHPWLWFRMAGVHEAESAPGLGRAFVHTLGDGHVLVTWGGEGRIDRRIDATSPDDLTHAEIACRRAAHEAAERLRATVPGFAHAYVTDTATQLGITESRRLTGRYVLGRDDLDHPFPDSIAVTGHWTKYACTYAIPYRSLLPSGISNLLVAGRCISVDHRVHHATKEIPACMATGEAAGTAAALAVRGNGAAADVDVPALRAALRRRGAIVD